MTKILIPLIIVILLLAVGIYLFAMPKTSGLPAIGPGAVRPSSEVVETKEAGQTDALTSLKELVSQGIPQRCTFDYQDPDSGKNTGTMFISGSKLRGDFMIKDETGKVTNGGIITDDAFLYTWDNDTKEGFKMAITADIKEQTEEVANNPSKAFDMDKKANYSCSPWVVQSGIFNPPQDVQFADFSEMMKGWGESTSPAPQTGDQRATDETNLCETCVSLPAEAQAQCKESLNCP